MNTIKIDEQARTHLAKAQETPSGRASHMVVGGPGSTMTQTIVALTAGSELHDHENPGEATVLVLEGTVELGSAESTWTASRGEMVQVPPARHHLIATTDAVVLLTAVKLNRGDA